MPTVTTLVHAVLVLNYVGAILFDLMYVKVPEEVRKFNTFGGRLRFLTFWNMLLQALFFTVCLLNDVVGTNEPNPKKTPLVRNIRDTLFTALAFPLSMFVGSTFWGLYAIDRELVFPKILDKYFPVWLNHVMHTNIMVFVIIEMVMNYRSYPKRKTGITILSFFMLCYLVWIHIIHHYSGLWVYPVLEVLNLPLRIVFFAVLLLLITFMYFLGEGLNSVLWSSQIKAVKSNKSKKRH